MKPPGDFEPCQITISANGAILSLESRGKGEVAVTHLEHPTNWVVMEGLNHNTGNGSAAAPVAVARSP